MTDYNLNTKSDMPLDQSFTPQTEKPTAKKPVKPKINVIGKKSNQKKQSNKKQQEENSKLRTKLKSDSVDIADLEKLNEENIKNYRFRHKRNKVIIVILAVLLVIAIAVITVFMVVNRLETNCDMIINGNADAVCFVNGEELSNFRTPANVQGNRVLNLDVDVQIKGSSSEYYNVKFYVITYQRGHIMSNTLIYKPNFNLFYENQDGSYSSSEPIRGNQQINICDGIILDSAKIYSTPAVAAEHAESSLTHEAQIGKIAGEQLLKLMTLGLTREAAEQEIIKGFLD